jgi:membrane fusion protein, multidrug efflux system
LAFLQTHGSRTVAAVLSMIVLLVLGALSVYRGNATASEGGSQVTPPEVDVANVLSRTITEWQTYSGHLEAVERVDVRPLVSGAIASVNFRDGALVQKGDVLFVIDPRQYQAEVDRLAAQLAAAKAHVSYVQSDWERAQRLIGDHAIARRDYDEKQNAALEAAANVRAANAALEAARINLSYTRIVAPVTGRVSRAEMTVGNVVSAGASAAPLTTLVSVSPIYAAFEIDEQAYLHYMRGAHDNRKIPVAIGFANEAGYSRAGVIESIDNRLDMATGTIRVRARLDNHDGTLAPGLYARVRVGGAAPHEALLIDDSAIGTNQNKKFVLVVDEAGHVSYREVQLGTQQGNQRVITSGLSANERIVVSGTQRVQPGQQVKVHLVPMTGGDAVPDA